MNHSVFLAIILVVIVIEAAGCKEANFAILAPGLKLSVVAPSTPITLLAPEEKPEWLGSSLGPYFKVTKVAATEVNRLLPVRRGDEVMIKIAKACELGLVLALYLALPPLVSPDAAPEPWLVRMHEGADKRVSEGKVYGLPVRVACSVIGKSTVLPDFPILELTLKEYDEAGHTVGTQWMTLEPFLPKL